jgi:hypothetical protein
MYFQKYFPPEFILSCTKNNLLQLHLVALNVSVIPRLLSYRLKRWVSKKLHSVSGKIRTFACCPAHEIKMSMRVCVELTLWRINEGGIYYWCEEAKRNGKR